VIWGILLELNKAIEAALKAISDNQPDVRKTYKLRRSLEKFGRFHLLKPMVITAESEVTHGGVRVPVRIFYPHHREEVTDVILFFHGGGWVTGDIDSYNRVCAVTARNTGCKVVSVAYRLAPEYKFPAGLTDCYETARYYFNNCQAVFGIESNRLILMGDSAGGNLAAAVSLMARDKGGFEPKRQILIYPSTYYTHQEESPYESVRTNGSDYVLTAQRIVEYMELYQNTAFDQKSPYFAPLLAKDFSNQPDTLIITAEFDPLRDEGEDFGLKLRAAGNRVEIYRIRQAIHGFFSLPAGVSQVKKSYAFINQFLMQSSK